MSVTIKDVAREANVSPSTVSRVISENPRISEKTKKITILFYWVRLIGTFKQIYRFYSFLF